MPESRPVPRESLDQWDVKAVQGRLCALLLRIYESSSARIGTMIVHKRQFVPNSEHVYTSENMKSGQIL